LINAVRDFPVSPMSGWTRAITMGCVREFEAAGIASIHIEDQVYPKRASYHKGLEHIVPLQAFVERMTYTLQACRAPGSIIIERTGAFSALEGRRDELGHRGVTLRDLGSTPSCPVAYGRDRTWRSSAKKSLAFPC
jgi:hypothetical protein